MLDKADRGYFRASDSAAIVGSIQGAIYQQGIQLQPTGPYSWSGRGTQASYGMVQKVAVTVTPMCSPKLLKGVHPLRKPEDLRHHLLIHDNVTFDDGGPLWPAWLKGAGVEGIETAHGLRFSHAMLALEAAADGMGVAISMPVLGGADLATGRLVAPFGFALPLTFAYYIVCDEDTAERPDVVAFRNWLLTEAGREP